MSLAYELFWGVCALELLLWLVPSLPTRRVLAVPVLAAVAAASLIVLGVHPSVPTALLCIMSAYRACNLLRVSMARMHEKFLRRMALQASLWVIVGQAALLGLWQLGTWLQFSTYHLWLVLMYADLAIGLVLVSSTVRHFWKTRVPLVSSELLPDPDLPTLTVAIPARNETDDLEACLAALVASDYPKLEILVLDDCSQTKRTPEIIRSYAHAGVVFLRGHEPDENWLAKNQAYQQLFDEANGELVLFCGVDVRFQPGSLRKLVTAMLYKHKTMVSLIPRNAVPRLLSGQGSTLLQPMRYAWELALPRRIFHRPPVLSTCWLAKREFLASAGGFAAVSRSIVPESYFARLSAVQDGYSFMRSDGEYGISSQKSLGEQRATMVRTRYPQLHRRIELVLLLTLGELVCVLLPYFLLIMALLGHLSVQLTLVSGLTILSFIFTYMCIVALTYQHWLVRSVFLLPAAAIADILLLNYSMIRYEFSSVIWKGRNVCIPVMRLSDHLPQ